MVIGHGRSPRLSFPRSTLRVARHSALAPFGRGCGIPCRICLCAFGGADATSFLGAIPVIPDQGPESREADPLPCGKPQSGQTVRLSARRSFPASIYCRVAPLPDLSPPGPSAGRVSGNGQLRKGGIQDSCGQSSQEFSELLGRAPFGDQPQYFGNSTAQDPGGHPEELSGSGHCGRRVSSWPPRFSCSRPDTLRQTGFARLLGQDHLGEKGSWTPLIQRIFSEGNSLVFCLLH